MSSGRGLCDGLLTRPEESYRLGCDCDLETLKMERPRLELGSCPKEIKEQNSRIIYFKTVRYMYRTYVYVFNDAYSLSYIVASNDYVNNKVKLM